MKAAERRDELLRILRDDGYLSAADAAARLGVDTSTIRRDLARLDELGLVRRSHGGALPLRDEAEVPYGVKIGRFVPQKKAIGRLVASLIPDGATVILDTGSTALMVARALTEHRGITVITPDAQIAAELLFRPEIRLIVPGGELLAGTSALISQEAVESMSRYHVDLAVMAVDGVDPEVASNLNGAIVPMKRAMMDAAMSTMLAVDHSKFGVRKLMTVAPVRTFDAIVTDQSIDDLTAQRYPVPIRRAPVEPERSPAS